MFIARLTNIHAALYHRLKVKTLLYTKRFCERLLSRRLYFFPYGTMSADYHIYVSVCLCLSVTDILAVNSIETFVLYVNCETKYVDIYFHHGDYSFSLRTL